MVKQLLGERGLIIPEHTLAVSWLENRQFSLGHLPPYPAELGLELGLIVNLIG